MAYALAHGFQPTVAPARRIAGVAPAGRTAGVDDPLDAMRGIIACVLGSVLVFWLPLAFVLTR